MSIKLKTPQALEELQTTLKMYPHIQEVHFAGNGDHYFVKHEMKDEKKKGTGKFYGYLKCEQKVKKIVGERKFYAMSEVHTPETQIVETLTRDKILAMVPKDSRPTVENLIKENEALKAQQKK
jgi:hypothetical protein